MSTTWFIAKEYLKRLDIDFEEHGRKTFSVQSERQTETKVIEVFPGANWITLTTRLMSLDDLPSKGRREVYEKLLKANATLVEVNFGIDKKNCLILRNALPVTGISYDLFSCTYEAHLAGIKFFFEKMKDQLYSE
ncbi:MAG: type III secretion system chaperone [Candidatus Thorarchaeota archaeon]|nr:type III secretion system chaperone [Candidatus Thorarchaeota archaeon]